MGVVIEIYMLIYYTLLPSYALYTVIPYRPPPAVGSAERSGPSGPLIYIVYCTVPY
jgi:hypothetical protein